MTDYKKIKVKPEAIEYVRECLSRGHTLSHYLLRRTDLKRGTIFTCAPPETDESLADNYRHGPLLPEPGPATYVDEKAKNGSTIRMVPTPETDILLAEIVSEYLRSSKGRVGIFEEGMSRPSDPCMKAVKKTTWRAFEEEVYYILTRRDSSNSKVSQAIRDAKSAYPGLIGAITTLSELHNFAIRRKKLTLDTLTLTLLAENTEIIIVGAYDGEGYLIWDRSSSAFR